jgi:predicted NUDIX family phosphoesterase
LGLLAGFFTFSNQFLRIIHAAPGFLSVGLWWIGEVSGAGMGTNEQVLCVPRAALPRAWLGLEVSHELGWEDCLQTLESAGYSFLPRTQVEKDPSFKQLIPYVVVGDASSRRIGCYQRVGSEKRLHGLQSLGVGGHVAFQDAVPGQSLGEIVAQGMARELAEEFVALPAAYDLHFRGIINEETSAVGQVHLGLVFRMDILDAHALRPGAELQDFRWVSLSQAAELPLELWSLLALRIL